MKTSAKTAPHMDPFKRILIGALGFILILIAIALALVMMAPASGLFTMQRNVTQSDSMSYGMGSGTTGGGGMYAPAPMPPTFPGVPSSGVSGTNGTSGQRKSMTGASYSLLVQNAQESADKLSSLAHRLDGYVESSNVYEASSGTKTGYVTIRVPAYKLDLAKAAIRDIAIEVRQETVNAQDVTDEFTDLNARLKNLHAEEDQYVQIMKDSRNVQDTMEVASRLGMIRGQIEQMEAQQKNLIGHIQMATISVSLIAEADAQVFGIRWQPLVVIKSALHALLTGLTEYLAAVIYLLFTLPVLLLWAGTGAGLLYVVWSGICWFERKMAAATGKKD